MSRRLLRACLGVVMLVGGLVRAGEPGENPPLGGGAIVTAPEPDRVSVPLPCFAVMDGAILGHVPVVPAERLHAHPLLNMPTLEIACRGPIACDEEIERNRAPQPGIAKSVAEEELPVVSSLYASLPSALPTPTLYQLRPTARRTLAGSLLFGVNPALALLPTEKALDAPCDHPQQVAGDDVLSDMPYYEYGTIGGFLETEEMVRERNRRSGDWLKWLLSHWPIQRNVPGPEQNEGYIHPILPNTLVVSLMPVDETAEECDAPLVPTLEVLPMPQEDGKTADGITCPWMRQQAVDRHACQFADPQIGRSALENFERLEEADQLLGMAKEFARAGCVGEALEYCALAQELCPGSPCAARAAEVMGDLYVRLCKPESGMEESAEEGTDSHDANNHRKHRSKRDHAIDRCLAQAVSLNFTNASLRQIIDDLRTMAGINIYVDEPALIEAGISPDQRVSLKLDDISLKSALTLLLHSVHLTYIVEGDVLRITTEKSAQPKLEQRAYAVADLLGHEQLPRGCGRQSYKGKSREERLIELITSATSPHSWSDMGGRGTITYFPPTQSVIVKQEAEVHEMIVDLLASLRRLYAEEGEKKEESCPETRAGSSKAEPGVEQQVNGLMKACRLLMNAGLHEQAAELARQAFVLDPERVAADPLVYKMHLLAVTPATHSAGSEEASEPPSCPYCPPAGKPIREIIPAKKKPKSDPATSSVPSGSEEASEEAGPSSLGELAEAMMGGPGRAQFGFGLNGDGSLRLCGECTYFGTVYHVLFSRGALAIWKTPDAAAVQP